MMAFLVDLVAFVFGLAVEVEAMPYSSSRKNKNTCEATYNNYVMNLNSVPDEPVKTFSEEE